MIVNFPANIELTSEQVKEAVRIGIARYQNVKNNSLPDDKTKPKNTDCEALHVAGALGECAFASFFNLPWEGYHNGYEFKLHNDVGKEEVRTTKYSSGNLILHPTDHDDARYWLLIGYGREYRICGWILGINGKNRRFWGTFPKRPTRPCYIISQQHLIKELDTGLLEEPVVEPEQKKLW